MSKLWVESYRPTTLDGYVFSDQAQKETIDGWIKEKSIPQVLLSGGPGCGKTTLAKILVNLLEIDPFDFMEINASRENGIDTIRDKITNFVQTMPFGDFKVVLLDECLDEDTIVFVLRDNQEIEVKIKDVDHFTDLVKSYNIEEQRVEWKTFELFDKGKRETLMIEFENDEVVICTPEHKWYVEDNDEIKVIRADQLEHYGHVLTQ